MRFEGVNAVGNVGPVSAQVAEEAEQIVACLEPGGIVIRQLAAAHNADFRLGA